MRIKMKVAIQGSKTSFHDMAATKYCYSDKVELIECRTFRDLCRATAAGKSDIGIMAIENTLVGSILPNYALISEFNLSVVGETYVRIEQHLLALPGQKISNISIVRSHPMALLQCSEFLDNHPHLIGEETVDTAESARVIRDERLLGVAAIGSRASAALYRLELLRERIENLKTNYTRFLALSRNTDKTVADANKASLCLRIKHQVGGLAVVLDVFRQLGINLSLIQSIAIPTHPHEYAFLIDLEFADRETFSKAICELTPHCTTVTIHGIYHSGTKPHDYAYSKTA